MQEDKVTKINCHFHIQKAVSKEHCVSQKKSGQLGTSTIFHSSEVVNERCLEQNFNGIKQEKEGLALNTFEGSGYKNLSSKQTDLMI